MLFAVSRFKRLWRGMVVTNLPSEVFILQCFLPSKTSKLHCLATFTNFSYEQSATLIFNFLPTLIHKLHFKLTFFIKDWEYTDCLRELNGRKIIRYERSVFLWHLKVAYHRVIDHLD